MIADLSLNASSKNFGSTNLYEEKTFEFTLSNTGTGTASSVSISGLADSFSISSNGCSSSLEKDSSCSFTVKYSPDDIGEHDDTAVVSYSDGADSQSLSASLSGYVQPNITEASPSSGVPNNPLTITGTNFNSQVLVQVGSAECVKSSVTATQIVCTTPSNTLGAKVISVSRNSRESLYSSFTYVSNASLGLSVSDHDFGSVIADNTDELTITVSNSGGYEAGDISFDGLAAPYSKTGGTCGDTLAAGSSCTAVITYAPTSIGTGQEDVLEVSYNDGSQAAPALAASLSGSSLDRVVQASGGSANCYVFKSGSIKCVGHGFSGKLGNGIQANSTTLVAVLDIDNAVQVSSNSAVCARLSDGTVKCWGKPYYPADSTIYDTPQVIAGLTDVAEIEVGYNIICARMTSGEVKCWGEGSSGELGGSTDEASPQTISGITATDIAAGKDHVCAIDSAKDVYCWGNNEWKQIGTGDINIDYTTPTKVDGLSNIAEIGAGDQFTCARTEGKQVYCWGSDYFGQLADNSPSLSLSAVDAAPTLIGVSDVEAIAVGNTHACALISGGTVKCWGGSQFGQVGNDDFSTKIPNVQDVSNLTDVAAISAGDYNTCALKNDAQVYCWGSNSVGQLNNGDTTDSAVPVQSVDLYE